MKYSAESTPQPPESTTTPTTPVLQDQDMEPRQMSPAPDSLSAVLENGLAELDLDASEVQAI
jgi:hypothetical protein